MLSALGPEGIATFIISLSGIVTGFLAVFMISTSIKNLGGKVGSAFWYIMWGVFLQTAAFSYTLAVSVGLIPNFPDGLYRGIISAGLVLFVLGAKKFSDINR